MSFLNYSAREINCKVVYYGPGLCGKTTNLQYIHKKTVKDSRGKLISLATETDRTLFFDFMPLKIGKIKGFDVRFHLYTVPGQVFYNASRKLILKGVDGVVFVADSQKNRMDANIESLGNLASNLKEYNLSIRKLPLVLAYNKRDLPAEKLCSIEEMQKRLNSTLKVPYLPSSAFTGQGIFETLKVIAKLVLIDLKKGA